MSSNSLNKLHFNSWYVRLSALSLFFFPFLILKINVDTPLRFIALFLIGCLIPYSFLLFGFRAAALQANQDLRAPCSVLSSGFSASTAIPKIFQLPGFTLLMTVGPTYSLATLLKYPIGFSGMLIGTIIGCLFTFMTIWILWRFATIAQVENANCQPGTMYSSYGAWSTPPATTTPSTTSPPPEDEHPGGRSLPLQFQPPSAYASPTRKRTPRQQPQQQLQEKEMHAQVAQGHFLRGIQYAQQMQQQQQQAQRVRLPRKPASVLKPWTWMGA